MNAPSLRAAQRELDQAIDVIEEAHARSLKALPDNHTWRDVDSLEFRRSQRTIAAYKAFNQAKAEFERYCANNDDERSAL
jgi:hypothetical protein